MTGATDDIGPGLELFFQHGTRSDAHWLDSPFEPRRNPAMLGFYELNNISFKWWPTMLDYYFYTSRSTYRKLRRYDKGDPRTSSAAPSRRSDILLALEHDHLSLVEHLLSSIDEPTKRAVERIQ